MCPKWILWTFWLVCIYEPELCFVKHIMLRNYNCWCLIVILWVHVQSHILVDCNYSLRVSTSWTSEWPKLKGGTCSQCSAMIIVCTTCHFCHSSDKWPMVQGKHSVVKESVLSSLHYKLLSGSLRHLMSLLCNMNVGIYLTDNVYCKVANECTSWQSFRFVLSRRISPTAPLLCLHYCWCPSKSTFSLQCHRSFPGSMW